MKMVLVANSLEIVNKSHGENMLKKFFISKILLSFLITTGSFAQYKAEVVMNLDGVIWGIQFLDKNNVLLSLRKGELYLADLRTKKTKMIPIPKVIVKGQGGLLDVYLFKKDLFITYADKVNGQLTTSLAKAKLKDGKPGLFKRIFSATVAGSSGRHFGSRVIVKDGFLYMTIGDRGDRDYSQDLKHHNGKILRLTLEGKTAPGNPFLGKEAALPEIWSYGHRNPQGIAINPNDGQIYSCEFGPKGGDELNYISKGKNYGWPIITYGREYWGPKIGETHKNGMEQPLIYWTPSISPSGMNFYTGNKIREWNGNLFLANLSSRHLRRLVLKGKKILKEEVLFKELEERVRHVANGPDGHLYFSTDSGKLYKVTQSVKGP